MYEVDSCVFVPLSNTHDRRGVLAGGGWHFQRNQGVVCVFLQEHTWPRLSVCGGG